MTYSLKFVPTNFFSVLKCFPSKFKFGNPKEFRKIYFYENKFMRRCVFRTMYNICYVTTTIIVCHNSERRRAASYFCKKPQLNRSLTGSLIHLGYEKSL